MAPVLGGEEGSISGAVLMSEILSRDSIADFRLNCGKLFLPQEAGGSYGKVEKMGHFACFLNAKSVPWFSTMPVGT